MHNEIPTIYLQQHKITKSQPTNFSQMPHAAESLQLTMNPYLMGGSSISSNKPILVFTGTDPEFSVEDYPNAVTAKLFLNTGPEPVNTPLHQNCHTSILSNRNNTRYQNSQQNYRSSTPKHQRQINQVQSSEEPQPDPLVLTTTKAQNRN